MDSKINCGKLRPRCPTTNFR